jgi:methylmalonyl-CoA mutase
VQTGGFSTVGKEAFSTAEEAADAALASDARIIVLCSSDETYPELAPAFAQRIKQRDPQRMVVLAGHPGDHAEAFKQAGFDEFIHIRSNVRETLASFQQKTGVAS